LKPSTGPATGSKQKRSSIFSLRLELFLVILAVTLVTILSFSLITNYLVRRQFEHAYQEMPRMEPPPEPMGGVPPEWEDAKRERIDVVNYSYIFTGLLGVLLAFLLSWYFANRISHPISELTEATRSIAGGEYGKRVEVHGADEVEELGAAFNALSESLEHNEQLRKSMIADISHELRNPLAAQQGNLEALEDGVIQLDPEVLEVLIRNNHLLTRLVEDLRQLALVDAGQVELDLMPVDPVEALRTSAAGLERDFKAKGVALELDTVPDLPAVMADQLRLSQVLGNLLRNALQYTPEGGTVTLGARAAGKEVSFSVADTGTGIPAEELPNVFERFYRTDKSRARDTGGSGLGLSIAKGLVEAQGGRIGVESEPGRGAAISFTLPLA
jgi:signal transduction histidine kinase